jgi:hypothetical protein
MNKNMMNTTEPQFEYKQINSKFIVSDVSYQRTVDMKRVSKIVTNFNENLVNPIKVSYRDNKYYVFDGQHTLAALKLRNKNKDLMVDCKVYYGLTQQDEAKLFSEQNGLARVVDSVAKFKALYVAGDQEIVNFKEVTESLGVKMNFTKGKANNKIIACTKAFKIFKFLPLQDYMDLVTVCKNSWDGAAEGFCTEILGGMYVFFKNYKSDISLRTLESQLSKISPTAIVREGKLSTAVGDEKYAKQIFIAYNKNLRTRKLRDKF